VWRTGGIARRSLPAWDRLGETRTGSGR
jgi:hypothetical protein